MGRARVDGAAGDLGVGPPSGLASGSGKDDGRRSDDDGSDSGDDGLGGDEPEDDGGLDGGDENSGRANDNDDNGDDDGNGELNVLPESGHGAVEEAVVGRNVGNVLSLTTVFSINASVLMESSGNRFKDLMKYVKGFKEDAPDIIAVTEMGGYSGVAKIHEKMVGPLRKYKAVYSQRPLGSGNKQAGAGILLLYKREKFKCGDLPLPGVCPVLFSGYVRSFCLWRKQNIYAPL